MSRGALPPLGEWAKQGRCEICPHRHICGRECPAHMDRQAREIKAQLAQKWMEKKDGD